MGNSVEHKTNGHMKRPTMDEVVLHGAKMALPKDQCMAFYDHYEANGWKVGRNPMKLWTAAMSNWKRTWLNQNPQFQSTSEVSFRDVKNLCREKWGSEIEWMSWASVFRGRYGVSHSELGFHFIPPNHWESKKAFKTQVQAMLHVQRLATV